MSPNRLLFCIFSTISSGLNSLAAVALTDFIKPLIAPNMSEKKATNVSKLLGKIPFYLSYLSRLLSLALSSLRPILQTI